MLVGQEVPELAVSVVPNRRLQRHRCLRRPQDLLHLVHRTTYLRRELRGCRIALQLRTQDPLGAVDVVELLDHVHRQADRPRLVRQRSSYRLPNPPGCIGGELEPAAVVELLDRPHQPDRPLLDQVQQRQAPVAVLLRDRHHETQVGLHHLLLRASIAALDPLGQVHLLRRRQQLDLGDVLQVELQRVEECARVRASGGEPWRPGDHDLSSRDSCSRRSGGATTGALRCTQARSASRRGDSRSLGGFRARSTRPPTVAVPDRLRGLAVPADRAPTRSASGRSHTAARR